MLLILFIKVIKTGNMQLVNKDNSKFGNCCNQKLLLDRLLTHKMVDFHTEEAIEASDCLILYCASVKFRFMTDQTRSSVQSNVLLFLFFSSQRLFSFLLNFFLVFCKCGKKRFHRFHRSPTGNHFVISFPSTQSGPVESQISTV